MAEHLRRSFLYTPADDLEMMEKAVGLDTADAVIFDLEDAIPDAAVADARENIASALHGRSVDRTEVCVRINGLQTPHWESDLRAATAAGVDTVILPMVERPAQLDQAIEVADAADGEIPEFIVTIETPKGLFAVDEIAIHGGSSSHVTGLSYGFGDYTRAIGATGKPARIHDFLSELIVSAAAVGGLDPIATVYQDFTDTAGLRDQATECREIGYIGQKAIHPAQIEVINEMYTPTPEEVEKAKRFVDTFDSADRDSLVVDGVFLDTAIVDQYRTVLSRHEEVAE
ncbi:HpcH/HpaI aldolase/citrate lyase family protein [Haladaptatus caseinilyticus]|uniref:HpcH/HpaI aldolase/citrate lyase family protein n=1 Tax=Haladaptatus caseinilyticus TaxID=2993314 RepID=UPI00224B1181|nr:CoA ester lyase [Haladaptatus caseinilyticus]